MPHEAAAGQRGAGLFKKFDLTTIPALVLLDGKGNFMPGCLHPLQSGPDGQQLPLGHNGETAGKVTKSQVCTGGLEGSACGTGPIAEPTTSTPQATRGQSQPPTPGPWPATAFHEERAGQHMAQQGDN
jgi:hypothetical protein